jgi:hypothetical protein
MQELLDSSNHSTILQTLVHQFNVPLRNLCLLTGDVDFAADTVRAVTIGGKS